MKDPKVAPDAQQAYDALQTWMEKEITEVSKRAFETGKFLFGVSSGAIGLHIAISKFTAHEWRVLDMITVAFFVISACVALRMVMPTKLSLGARVDLTKAQEKIVNTTWMLGLAWVLSALIGLLFGCVAFFFRHLIFLTR